MPSTRSSVLAFGGTEELLLEQVVLATLVIHPALAQSFESALELMDLSDPDLGQLRNAILLHCHDPENLRQYLQEQHRTVVETLLNQSHVTTAPPVRNTEDTELARMCLAEGLAKLDARRGARREIEDAAHDLTGLADEGLTWRLTQATQALHRAEKSNLEQANDMGEDRAALSKHLQNLIDGEAWVKKKG